jgi:probable phosphoglycerate mutase
MPFEMKGSDGSRQSGLVTDNSNKPPRQCSNCIWYSEDTCSNELITTDPELVQLRTDGGKIRVKDDWCSNGFQSQGNAIIYIMRHGETGANKSDKFRGWIEVPLNEQGVKEAKQARKYLADKGIQEVFCSDLGRAVNTARIVMPGRHAEKDKLLRPWDVGMFSGKSRETNQGALNHYIDNPEIQIPGGESLKEFSDRQKKAFEKYVKIARLQGPILLVAHSSNAIQAEKLVEGKDELGRPEDVDRVTPGGVMVILDQGEDGMKAEIPFGEKPATRDIEANYGS